MDATFRMISDQRRPPFCYQTHDALDLIRERFTGAKRVTAIAVYVVMTEFANREGGESARSGFRAARSAIAEAVGVSLDTLDRYVLDFTDARLVSVQRERVGEVNLPNVWTLLDVRTGAPPGRTDAARGGRTGAAQEKETTTKETTPDGVDLVRLAWRDHAPPLVEHRDPYLSSAKATTAIKTALKIYPADVVVAAVVNYATVLGSDEYRWSYQWTLIDFLKRGLDRFVPEAKPLERERVRTDGQARRTFDDLPSF